MALTISGLSALKNLKLKTIPQIIEELFTIGGTFTQITNDFVNTNNVVQINSDASVDTTFNFGTGFTDGNTYSSAEQSDGKIVVGGQFSTYNGTTQNNITRLNTDGSVDTLFNIGTGFDNVVFSTVIQPDGKIVAGGAFSTYNGTTQNCITRLNTDGSRDTSFSIGTGFNGTVTSIKIQSDGKIVVGGEFTSYNGTAQNYITRLNTDGSRDTSFSIGTGFSDLVSSTAIQTDGKIVVGGAFTLYNGTTQNYITRLNIDGSIDTSFSIGTGFDSVGYSLAIQSDGKILVGGFFSTYNETTQYCITRLNTDGSRDTSFNIGTGFDDSVRSVVIQSDGKIVVGGQFSSYNDTLARGFVRLNSDGTRDLSFMTYGVLTSASAYVFTVTLKTNNKIFIGGGFQLYAAGPQDTQYITKTDTDGLIKTTFNTGTGFNAAVNVVKVQSDGKIIAGGQFVSYNGTSQNRIIRINTDGSVDTSFSVGSGFNATVNAIEIQLNGKILVGGSFTSYNGTTQNYITRLNTDGSIDTSFNIGTGFDATVRSIASQSNGKTLVVGSFTSFNGTTQNYITRLNTDGSIDTSFSIGSGFSSTAQSVRIQSDGKILVGGQFVSYNGTSQNRIIRINTDGSIDTSFNVGSGFTSGAVLSVAIQPDGKIVAGGIFTSYNGTTQNYITRINTDGSRDTSFSVGSGFNNTVNSVIIQSDGKILVGGQFNTYNGTSQYSISSLNTDGTINSNFKLFILGTVLNVT